jgi:hypothetical protein
LAALAAKHFRVGYEVTMDGGRQLDGELHRFVVLNGR